jgi:hypothetical protein
MPLTLESRSIHSGKYQDTANNFIAG